MAPPSSSLYARAFAADAKTEQALRAGLAGRETKVQRARFKAALRALSSESPSRVVFVDFDGVPDPGAAARELVAVCPLGTVLIALGADDTAHFNRALLRHGIADYLVKPISTTAVREACTSDSDAFPEHAYAGRVVAFAGSAGSGVSSLVAAVARAAAGDGRTVSVVDFDPDGGALAALLGAAPVGDLPALLDALVPPDGAEPESPEADDGVPDDYAPAIAPERIDAVCAAVEGGDAISFIAPPAAGEARESPSPAAVSALLAHLANRAHVVLATGVSDPTGRAELLRCADARVLFYEPTLQSIGAAVRCLALLGREHEVTLVQSHPRMARSALSAAQIRYALAERRPDVVIPFDRALHAAATGAARPRAPGKAYRKALGQLLERAVGGPASAAP